MKTVKFEIVAYVKDESILGAYHKLCTLFQKNQAEVLVVSRPTIVSNGEPTVCVRTKSVDLDSL